MACRDFDTDDLALAAILVLCWPPGRGRPHCTPAMRSRSGTHTPDSALAAANREGDGATHAAARAHDLAQARSRKPSCRCRHGGAEKLRRMDLGDARSPPPIRFRRMKMATQGMDATVYRASRHIFGRDRPARRRRSDAAGEDDIRTRCGKALTAVRNDVESKGVARRTPRPSTRISPPSYRYPGAKTRRRPARRQAHNRSPLAYACPRPSGDFEPR